MFPWDAFPNAFNQTNVVLVIKLQSDSCSKHSCKNPKYRADKPNARRCQKMSHCAPELSIWAHA